MSSEQQSSRLVLDVPSRGDCAEIFAIASDPRTWTHIPGERSSDPKKTAELVEMFREGWTAHGLSNWVVRLGLQHEDPRIRPGMLLGTGGVHLFEPPAASPFWNLGYRIAPEGWGRGFATEVASRAVGIAREVNPEAPVIARVLSTNPASAKVAQKAGLKLAWQGAPSKETIAAVGQETVQRLIFADRDLDPGMLGWLASRG